LELKGNYDTVLQGLGRPFIAVASRGLFYRVFIRKPYRRFCAQE
jgi:hypothetical protein